MKKPVVPRGRVYTKKRNFVVDYDDDEEECDFYRTNVLKVVEALEWSVGNLPEFIISVTGGAQIFTMPKHLTKDFKKGLIKAAYLTNSWILTGGTNSGVMRLVGDAINEEFHMNLVCIGVSAFDKIAERTSIFNDRTLTEIVRMDRRQSRRGTIVEDTEREANLDPNHTHHVLVSNPGRKTYGVEIKFRAELEKALVGKSRERSQSLSNFQSPNHFAKPIVLIVVEGGKNTLRTVVIAIENKIPIILLKGSRRCADLVSNVFTRFVIGDECLSPRLLQDEIENTEFIHNYQDTSYEQVLEQTIEMLSKLVDNCKQNPVRNLIHILNVEHDSDIETLILDVFIKSQRHEYLKSLERTLKWDRIDLARKYLNAFYLQSANSEQDYTKKLYFLLDRALIYNKPKFVEFILESGLVCLTGYFTDNDRLIVLYENQKTIAGDLKTRQRWYKNQQAHLDHIIKRSKSQILVCYLEDKYFKKLKHDFKNRSFVDMIFWENLKSDEAEVNLRTNLFIWSLFMGHIEMALYFWQNSKDHIFLALLASYLLKRISRTLDNPQLEIKARDFDRLACRLCQGLFESIRLHYQKYKENTSMIEMRRNAYTYDCLKIASKARSIDFISMPMIQDLLNKEWEGTSDIENSHNSYYSQNIDSSTINNNENRPKRNYFSPKICFISDTAFFILFLIFYSYFLLYEFEFRYELLPMPFSSAVNDTNATINERNIRIKCANNMPGYSEWLLVFWISMLTYDEFKQYFSKYQSRYFKMGWNIFDFLGCAIFAIAFLVRIFGSGCEPSNKYVFSWARVFYAISLNIWYTRLLHGLIVSKDLGPKLLMIRKMITEVGFFLIIVLIFIFSFGITTRATMYPNGHMNVKRLFQFIINNAYWPIYGEIKILDDLHNEDETEPADSVGTGYSFILLMIYMIFVNILLVNLLIAMFSSQFKKVEENTDQIWMHQNYLLIREYKNSHVFAPPFNMIADVCIWAFYCSVKIVHRVKHLNKNANERDQSNAENMAMLQNEINTKKTSDFEIYFNKIERNCAREAIIKNDTTSL